MKGPALSVAIALVVIAAIAVGGYVLNRRSNEPRVGTFTGKIQKLDLAAGRAEVELIHPRTGRAFSISWPISDGIEILLDGHRAGFADLLVGDPLVVETTIYSRTDIRPNWVKVNRSGGPASTASAPATRPARASDTASRAPAP